MLGLSILSVPFSSRIDARSGEAAADTEGGTNILFKHGADDLTKMGSVRLRQVGNLALPNEDRQFRLRASLVEGRTGISSAPSPHAAGIGARTGRRRARR